MADERAKQAAEKIWNTPPGTHMSVSIREMTDIIATEYADVIEENERLKADERVDSVDAPASEADVAELLGVLNGAGSKDFVLTLRRLAFQRDALLAENERLKADWDQDVALGKDYHLTALRLEQENGRLKAELDSEECFHDDEMASHQETLLLWQTSKERLAALEQQVAHLTADADETDQHIREAAKRVLPVSQVDGDAVCVPPLEEVVDAMAQQVAELRRIVDRYHHGLTGACSQHRLPDLSCNTCYPNLRLLLEHHVERSREIVQERDEARQQVAELRADAERYRWLRNWIPASTVQHFSKIKGHAPEESESQKVDSAIDAVKAR